MADAACCTRLHNFSSSEEFFRLLSFCNSFFLLRSYLFLLWFGHHYHRALLQVSQEQKLVTFIQIKTCCGHFCHGLSSPPCLGHCVEVLRPWQDTYDAETAGQWTILLSKTMIWDEHGPPPRLPSPRCSEGNAHANPRVRVCMRVCVCVCVCVCELRRDRPHESAAYIHNIICIYVNGIYFPFFLIHFLSPPCWG